MNIETQIKEAMVRMIERNLSIEGVTVSSWEDEFERITFAGCQTCGPEYEDTYNVNIYYSTPDMSWGSNYNYSGKFTDLIKELDEE